MNQNLTRTSLLLSGISALVKPVGMVREVYVAAIFGTSVMMDAWNVAYSVPMLFISLIRGVFLGGFTPVFASQHSIEDQGRLHRAMLGWTLIALPAVVLPIAAFSGSIVAVLAPGLDQSSTATAAKLLLVLLPFLAAQCLVEYHRILLNALGRFLSYAIVPAIGSLLVIAWLVFRGKTIEDLAIGTAIAAGLVLVLLIVVVWRAGIAPWPPILRSSALRPILGQVPFLLASSMLLHVNALVDRNMASGLEEGAIAALGYSYRLILMLQLLMIQPLEAMILSVQSSDIAAGKWGEFLRRLTKSIRMAVLLAAPVVVGLVLCADALIEVLYQRGNFDAEATRRTAGALAAYAPTILVLAATISFPRYFNVVRRNRILTLQTAISVVLNLVFNYLFVRIWGHVGIAASTTLTIFLGRVLLIAIARHDLRGREGGLRLQDGLRPLVAATIGALALAGILRSGHVLAWPAELRLGTGVVACLTVFGGMWWILFRTEVLELLHAFGRRRTPA